MSTIIKRNIILSPTDYDGVSNQKGIVTFEILGDQASGFLRCYNLEKKDNLIFGVQVNDNLYKFKLNSGEDTLNFSLGNINNLTLSNISCVLVWVNNKNTQTLLMGSTETTKLYSNEILNFLNNTDHNENIVEKNFAKNKVEEKLTFFNNDLQNKSEQQNCIFKNNSVGMDNQLSENEEDEEFSNFIDDLTQEDATLNKCKNCMYKNYFYCQNQQTQTNMQKFTDEKAINVESVQRLTQTGQSFYDSLSGQINSLISTSAHEEVLEEVLPNSTFVRIDNQKGSYYVLGVINNENGIPEYLCYGHPAKTINDKPFNYDNHFSFFPLDVDDPHGEGYYLSYQSAQNGENVKVTLI